MEVAAEQIIRDYKDGLILFLNQYVHNIHIAEEIPQSTTSGVSAAIEIRYANGKL
jgi:hypothetical protein